MAAGVLPGGLGAALIGAGSLVAVLGYVDDLLIVPLGIALVIRLIPADVMEEQRALATLAQQLPASRAAAARRARAAGRRSTRVRACA